MSSAQKPTFSDRESYLSWKATWQQDYRAITRNISALKKAIKAARGNRPAPKMQRQLSTLRAQAAKLMAMRQEGTLRRDRILGMHKQLAEQAALFPLTLKNCRIIDFHFNKGSLEYSFLPMWTLKTQGKSYYVKHFVSQMGFETRELEEGSTRGMLRMRYGDITIDADGIATITSAKVELAEVA